MLSGPDTGNLFMTIGLLQEAGIMKKGSRFKKGHFLLTDLFHAAEILCGSNHGLGMGCIVIAEVFRKLIFQFGHQELIYLLVLHGINPGLRKSLQGWFCFSARLHRSGYTGMIV